MLLVSCRLQDAFITYADYAARAHARIVEIAAEQASVAALSITGPDQTATVSQVRPATNCAQGSCCVCVRGTASWVATRMQ